MASVTFGATGIDFSDYQTTTPAGSMTQELLDHYEEGTWTPVLKVASTSITSGINSQDGDFLRIADLCHIAFYWYRNSQVTDTGHVHMSNVPYTFGGAAAAGSYQSLGAGYLGHSGNQYGDTGGGKGARWQHNSGNQFQLYAEDGSHDGSGTSIEAHGYGAMRIFQ